MNSFTEKKLRVTLTLASGNEVFPGTNSNTLVLEGLRMSAKLQAISNLATIADVRIYGMRQADMDAFSVMWAQPPIVRNNLMTVETNSTGKADGWVQVFKGTIKEAQPDYRAMPDVSFSLLAVTGYYAKIVPVGSVSYPGEVEVTTVIKNIVAAMGTPWTLEIAEGVSGVLSSPIFTGTLWDQLASACAAAKCDFYIQGDKVLITKFQQPFTSIPAVVLNASSGLVGYPMYEQAGLSVTALYNPAFLCGVAIELESPVPNVNGRWYPYSLSHNLESLMPRGAWMSQMLCTRVHV